MYLALNKDRCGLDENEQPTESDQQKQKSKLWFIVIPCVLHSCCTVLYKGGKEEWKRAL